MSPKKQEVLINKLYDLIKKTNLEQDDIAFLNVQGFLYSVGKLNQLQTIAILTSVALNKGITINEISEALE